MEKILSLAEVKAFYNEERCFETETGFLVNNFGKYSPNITFVVPKTYFLDKNEKPINPLKYTEDREVTDNMNLDFDGSASFIFGDFWRSKKGGACFRPKSPMQAKHLLICVDWGGCFNSHRGNYPDDVKGIDGVLYFRRASSNGGGAGCDYWVVPVGFSRILHIDEVDGKTKTDHTAEFERRAKDYRKKHADLQKKAIEEADTYLKEKAASEEASRNARERFIPRLTEIQAELAELDKPQKFGNYHVGKLMLGDTYFISYDQYLYNEESLAKAEAYLVRMRDWVTGEEAKEQAKVDARESFEPKYEELRSQIERIGWELSFGEEGALVKDPAKVHDAYYCLDNGVTSYSYNLDGVEKLREDVEKKEADRIAEEDTRARNAERIRKLLAGTDLPEELWFLFEGSEDLDSVIRKEVKAIMAAVEYIAEMVTVEPEDVEFIMHELCYCGHDRRCDAIYRVLRSFGGGIAKINIGSPSASKALAWFIAGLT